MSQTKTLRVLLTCSGIAALTQIIACSALQNMDDMKNTTNDLDGKTGQVVKDSGLINGTTCATYEDVQQTSSDLRQKDLVNMASIADPIGKFTPASQYMETFEFQLFRDKVCQDPTVMALLYRDAMDEFFWTMHTYKPDYKIDPASTDPNIINLSTLAAAMHKINTDAEVRDDADNAPQVSVLSLVKDGLTSRAAHESGAITDAELPAYQQSVQKSANDAVYMLQLRANYLPAMVLAKVTKIADRGFLGIPGLIRKFYMLKHKWDFDPAQLAQQDQFDLEQIREKTDWLNEAVTTSEYLKGIGRSANFDSRLKKIYSNMNFIAEPKPDPSASSTVQSTYLIRQQALGDFLKAKQAYLVE